MYDGYTESDEKIAARKARILESFDPQAGIRRTLRQVRTFRKRLMITAFLNVLVFLSQLQRLQVRWAMWQARRGV